MLFNSIEFAIFLPIVFVLYWFVFKKTSYQNFLIVVASYFFYAYWDWRFLILILLSTVVDFLVGIAIKNSTNKKNSKKFLIVSILFNFGLLFIFKYYNFFIDSFVELFCLSETIRDYLFLNIILPVGISFYTFQTVSYSIDVYRGNLNPTSDFIAFAAYVSYFPQLVAGPIERAKNLLPQFVNKRIFSYKDSYSGIKQILWGLFKKIVIADNCASIVNNIFNNHESLGGFTLFFGGILFAFQIYGDFSGYSDIAIGSSKLFGFKLMLNFKYPYFSRDIAEFWRRWHISLSTWFRDYLYIPLGGSKVNNIKKIRNVFIIFLVSGFWHGANWTFLLWGALNALYFLPLIIIGNNRNNIDVVAKGRKIPTFKESFNIITTFVITVLAWIVFRANSINDAFRIYLRIFAFNTWKIEDILNLEVSKTRIVFTIFSILILLIVEWNGRENDFPIDDISTNRLFKSRAIRALFYYSLFILVIFAGGSQQDFIYFQF